MLPIHEHKLSPSASSSSAIAQSQKSQARWKLATTRAANGLLITHSFLHVSQGKKTTHSLEKRKKKKKILHKLW
jgi:hypothetical protein